MKFVDKMTSYQFDSKKQVLTLSTYAGGIRGWGLDARRGNGNVRLRERLIPHPQCWPKGSREHGRIGYLSLFVDSYSFLFFFSFEIMAVSAKRIIHKYGNELKAVTNGNELKETADNKQDLYTGPDLPTLDVQAI